LKQLAVIGEAGSVSHATVAGWYERMKELTRGYKKEDIWNVNESGCFFKALPDKTKNLPAKEGKKPRRNIVYC
jgi:hypothetical protein